MTAGAGAGGGGAQGKAGGPGGASGSGGAGAGGGGARDAGAGTGGATDAGADAHRDASRTDGATAGCRVAADGGTVPCTTVLAGNVAHDFFCALKAGDGNVTCWGSTTSLSAMDIAADAPVWTNPPPHLVQLAASLDYGYPQLAHLCGVDSDGRGTCWDKSGSTDLGSGIVSLALSGDGSCILKTDGTVTCSSTGSASGSPGVIAPATGFHYTKVALSLHNAGALDDTGTPHYRSEVFPSGVYVDMVLDGAVWLGLVRDDGTVLTFAPSVPEPPAATVHPGSFTRLALDASGRACAIDRAGAIACWLLGTTDASLPLTPPTGSFTQIVGGIDAFCALRTSGTTVCWGDQEIAVPAGW
jgi:hypothetical protein